MKSFMNISSFLQLLLIASISLVSCKRSPHVESGAEAQAKRLVIFSQCNNAEPYRAAQNNRMKELFAAQSDVDFVIYDGQARADLQISQIENAIRQKPALLIVAPLQRDSLTRVMGHAMKAGIPTICLERDISEPNYTTHIRSDNRAIGQMAGRWIVRHLTEKYGEAKGTIVELQGMKGVEATINRHGGFQDVISQYPSIQIIHDATGNWFQPEATVRMEEALNANPRDIDVVFAHNDPMAYGAYLAAKHKNREREMVFVGVDGLPNEGVRYVGEGILGASFEYPLCVEKAVEIGMRMLNEPSFVPEKIYTMESRIITAD